MSAQNEHYLERIRFLEQELEQAKNSLRVCRTNLNLREHQVTVLTQRHLFFTQQFPVAVICKLNNDWMESAVYKGLPASPVTLYKSYNGQACDCIDILNHERREAYGED